jgi:ribonuclease-3
MYFPAIFCNSADKKNRKKLKSILGFSPHKIEIYNNAFSHSSAKITKNGHKINNERLEFVGDAIISAIVSDLIYKTYPDADEGKLSIYRSRIICRENLNNIACKLKLRKIINYREIYFDRGYKYCYKFLSRVIKDYSNLEYVKDKNKDYKSTLLQLIQKHRLNLSFNTFENCEANEKIQHFLCEICLDKKFLCSGKGWSKKEAEQNASDIALKILQEKFKLYY